MKGNENESMPKHVAIIMDGNNRWASDKGIPRVAGHQKGVERAREAVEHAVKRGLSTLTLFAFSSENWGRSQEEVRLLMKLLNTALNEEVPNLIKNSVQLNFIGDLSLFDDNLIQQMKKSEELTYCDKKDKKLDLLMDEKNPFFDTMPNNSISLINKKSISDFSNKISTNIEIERFRANIYIDGIAAWEERDWIGKTININNINFFVSGEISRCSATNLKPSTDIVTINLPNQLKKTYDHINMGLYIVPQQNGVISKEDKIIIHD